MKTRNTIYLKYIGLLIKTTVLVLLITSKIFAQNVVVTDDATYTPDASAILDVKSTTKGLLIPRIDLDDASTATPISSPATGLIIYNSGGDAPDGFYYWNGSAWISFITSLSDADGDTKIQVEESNDEDLIRFDIGGTERMLLTTNALEFPNSDYSVYIGEGAGNSITGNEDGYNVLIGYQSGYNSAYSSSPTNASYNVGIGFKSLYANTIGCYNTANGLEALYSNTNGSENTAIGFSALYFNTSGTGNVSLGVKANGNNEEGNYNTIIGYKAGLGTSIHNKSGNIFLGYQAGYNETGNNKLYIENSSSSNPLIYGDFDQSLVRIYGSLQMSTTGASINEFSTDVTLTGTSDFALPTENAVKTYVDNSIGAINLDQIIDADNDTKIQVEEAADEDMIRFDLGGTEKWKMTGSRLEVLSTGYSVFIGESAGANDDLSDNLNVAIGDSALNANTSGYRNSGIGYSSLKDNTSGYYNTGVGYFSLENNTTGYINSAIGSWALYTNTTGFQNAANGHGALYLNTTGNNNTAVGFNALYSNTTSTYNTAVGSQTMFSNTTGYSNSASGGAALYSNTTGYYNSALGVNASRQNTSGFYNTAMGYSSLLNTTTGDYNTSCGSNALTVNITGNNNTAIGYGAGPLTAYSALNNTILLGYNAATATTNHVCIGNTSQSWIGGQVSWSTMSDGRIKNNIKEDVAGLDFIMKLRPVTYNLDKDKSDELMGIVDSSDYVEKYAVEEIKFSGFLAQEVEQTAREVGYDFSGVKIPTNDKTLYSLSYAEFVVPLVKAVQEQQVIIEELLARIEELENK